MIKTNIEFVNKVKEIATNYKTLYVMGCFGAPLKEAHKDRYCNNYDYNKQPERTAMIKAASADTFGFDCVCLIKGLLWGWNGDKDKVYGGAEYCSNGVPDIDENVMINSCSGVTTDFSKIEIGEAVWMSGHIGVYIGDGLAVECTPAWENKVQITAVGNIGAKKGYNTRTWTKHGKLPYFTYIKENAPADSVPEKTAENTASVLHKGDEVTLKNAALYGASASTSKANTLTGTYWVHSDGIINNRIRITTPKGNSACTGWVDVADCGVTEINTDKSIPTIKVGSTVMLKKGAKTYDEGSLAPFTVSKLIGDKAVINYDNKVIATVNVSDLTLI